MIKNYPLTEEQFKKLKLDASTLTRMYINQVGENSGTMEINDAENKSTYTSIVYTYIKHRNELSVESNNLVAFEDMFSLGSGQGEFVYGAEGQQYADWTQDSGEGHTIPQGQAANNPLVKPVQKEGN